MVQMKIEYQGELRCHITHGPSETVLITDAPVDNRGKGQSFSPTDLVASALGACMVTIMGIKAQDKGWSLEGTRLSVKKIMSSQTPRKIERIEVEIHAPRGLEADQRIILERAAKTCPVALSLHPELQQAISFHWTLS